MKVNKESLLEVFSQIQDPQQLKILEATLMSFQLVPESGARDGGPVTDPPSHAPPPSGDENAEVLLETGRNVEEAAEPVDFSGPPAGASMNASPPVDDDAGLPQARKEETPPVATSPCTMLPHAEEASACREAEGRPGKATGTEYPPAAAGESGAPLEEDQDDAQRLSLGLPVLEGLIASLPIEEVSSILSSIAPSPEENALKPQPDYNITVFGAAAQGHACVKEEAMEEDDVVGPSSEAKECHLFGEVHASMCSSSADDQPPTEEKAWYRCKNEPAEEAKNVHEKLDQDITQLLCKSSAAEPAGSSSSLSHRAFGDYLQAYSAALTESRFNPHVPQQATQHEYLHTPEDESELLRLLDAFAGLAASGMPCLQKMAFEDLFYKGMCGEVCLAGVYKQKLHEVAKETGISFESLEKIGFPLKFRSISPLPIRALDWYISRVYPRGKAAAADEAGTLSREELRAAWMNHSFFFCSSTSVPAQDVLRVLMAMPLGYKLWCLSTRNRFMGMAFEPSQRLLENHGFSSSSRELESLVAGHKIFLETKREEAKRIQNVDVALFASFEEVEEHFMKRLEHPGGPLKLKWFEELFAEAQKLLTWQQNSNPAYHRGWKPPRVLILQCMAKFPEQYHSELMELSRKLKNLARAASLLPREVYHTTRKYGRCDTSSFKSRQYSSHPYRR